MIPLIRKKHINVHEVLEKSFPDVLIKDLQDDERICLTCHGLGMVIRNTPYGIRDDTSDAGKKKMFPYNNYYFSLCPDCFGEYKNYVGIVGNLILKVLIYVTAKVIKKKRNKNVLLSGGK